MKYSICLLTDEQKERALLNSIQNTSIFLCKIQLDHPVVVVVVEVVVVVVDRMLIFVANTVLLEDGDMIVRITSILPFRSFKDVTKVQGIPCPRGLGFVDLDLVCSTSLLG